MHIIIRKTARVVGLVLVGLGTLWEALVLGSSEYINLSPVLLTPIALGVVVAIIGFALIGWSEKGQPSNPNTAVGEEAP